MSKTATITTRIEPELKANLRQVKRQRGLPFKLELPISKNIPNAETLAAFEDTDGEVVDDFKAWVNEST